MAANNDPERTSDLTESQRKIARTLYPDDVCLYVQDRTDAGDVMDNDEAELAIFSEWVMLPSNPGEDYFAKPDMPTDKFVDALQDDLNGDYLEEDAALRGDIFVLGLGELWKPTPVLPSTLARAVGLVSRSTLMETYGGQIATLPAAIADNVIEKITRAYARSV